SRLARALSASVAAGALMLAASGGANAQSAAPQKSEASVGAAKKKAAPQAKVTAAAPAAGPYAMATKGPPVLVTPAWTGLYARVSFGPGLFRANTSTVFHSVNNQTVTSPTGTVQATTTTQDTLSGASGHNWGALSDVYLGYNFRPGGNLVAGVQVE